MLYNYTLSQAFIALLLVCAFCSSVLAQNHRDQDREKTTFSTDGFHCIESLIVFGHGLVSTSGYPCDQWLVGEGRG